MVTPIVLKWSFVAREALPTETQTEPTRYFVPTLPQNAASVALCDEGVLYVSQIPQQCRIAPSPPITTTLVVLLVKTTM